MRKRQEVTTATGRQVKILLHKENLIAKSITVAISITTAIDLLLLSDSTRSNMLIDNFDHVFSL